MQAIETAWKAFFRQFSPNVFTDGELIDDPTNTLYPRITFSYAMSDAFANTLTTFQVWDWSHNSTRVWAICNQIAEAVPIAVSISLEIPAETYHEYRYPISTTWTKFDINDFQKLADKWAPTKIEWRKVENKSAGSIQISRGSPFLTPSPKDEPLSRAMYGTLASRYLNIV